MGKANREHNLHYLNQQFSAMRWLAKQGVPPEAIREFRWGMVDEESKTISVITEVFNISYDRKTGVLARIQNKREVKLDIRGTGQEEFFLKSRIYCAWMFTAERPRSWRKEKSREALFPLEVVEKCCRDLCEINNSSILTNLDMIGNIRVSKANIKEAKNEELIVEGEVAEIRG